MKKKLCKCTFNNLCTYMAMTPKYKNELPFALKEFLKYYPGEVSAILSNQTVREFINDLDEKYRNMVIEV